MNTSLSSNPALPAGMPKQRLDHDFNSAWGSILCFDQLSAITTLNPLWREFATNRLGFENNYERLMQMYTERFVSFFGGYYPIDFQSTPTQAMKPTIIAKLIFWLASFSLAGASKTTPDQIEHEMVLKLLNWIDAQMETPRWAVLSDSYAAASLSSPGPSPVSTPSSNPDRRTPHTNESLVVNVSTNISQGELRAQLEIAKEQGCIGIVVETVETQYNGRVLDPLLLKRARRLCAEKNLVFAVDETLTAIRCGSPFSFQREEYSDIEPPDLVFFGRALAAQGSAVHFGAPMLKTLGLVDQKRRLAAIKGWQHKGPGGGVHLARPVPSGVLVQAMAAADLAAERELPMVSRLVGRAVRAFVMRHVREKGLRDPHGEAVLGPQDVMGGLESFIFVRKDVAAEFGVMGAGTAAQWMPWVRWFPRLEADLATPEALEATVGRGSRASRESLMRILVTQDAVPHWCFCCGNRAANEGENPWCRRCCINACEHEACMRQLQRHKCV